MSAASLVQVSRRLKRLLEDAFGADDVTPRPRVQFDDPAAPSSQDAARISLWLYQVTGDEFGRNAPVAEAENATRRVRFQFPPLGVNLFYLVTPLLGNPEAEQQALGVVLLTMHENPVLTVSQKDAEVTEQVRVSLVTDSLEERIKLWESLAKPYRPCLAYQVRTVRLVSRRADTAAPIVSASSDVEAPPLLPR